MVTPAAVAPVSGTIRTVCFDRMGERVHVRLNETTRTLLGLYFPSALVSFGQGMVVPITPALATAFDVPLGLAAQVVSSHLLGRLVLMIPSGALVDRYGARFSMIVGPVLILLCAAITLLTTDFFVLLAAQFLAGAGSGLWQIGREIIAIDLVPPRARARVLIGFTGISTAGTAIGPLLGGVINDATGFRGVFAASLMMAFVILGISLATRDAGTTHHRPARSSGDLGGLGKIDPFYRATYLVLIFSTLAATLRSTVSQSMLPLYVGSQLGYSSTEVGMLFGVMGFTNLLILGLAGWISDTFGRKVAVVPAAGMSALSFVLLPFATGLTELSAICVVMGIASGLAMGSMTVYTYDIAPPEARGRLQSLRRVIGETSGTTGPMVGGLIATTASPGLTFLIFAPFHLVSALLLAFVARESAGRKLEAERGRHGGHNR